MFAHTPERPSKLKREILGRWHHSGDGTHLFRCHFFVSPVTHDHIRGLSTKSRMNPFETTFFANLRGTVDILDVEHPAESVEDHFR